MQIPRLRYQTSTNDLSRLSDLFCITSSDSTLSWLRTGATKPVEGLEKVKKGLIAGEAEASASSFFPV